MVLVDASVAPMFLGAGSGKGEYRYLDCAQTIVNWMGDIGQWC